MNHWENAEQHAQRAYQFYESGQWEQALSELKRALAVNPNQSEWHFGMGLTLDAMQRHAEAAACFQRVLNLRGDDTEAMLHLAINLIHCERSQKALELLERIHELDPEYEPAYCYEILAHNQLGQHDQAEQAFYMARQLVDECPTCYDHVAQTQAVIGRHSRAIWCWMQVLRLDPQYPDVHANLARVYWDKGKLERARRLMMEQLRQYPGDTDSLLELGNLLMQMHRYGEAGEKFRRALERDPALAEPHLHLGELALLTEHLDSAQTHLRTAASLAPDLPAVHLRLAEVARRRNQDDEARRLLRRELRRTQDDPDQSIELAATLIEMHMIDSAIRVLTPLIDELSPLVAKDDPQLASALLYRGVAQMSRGATAKGIVDCRRAARLAPTNTVAMHNLVLAYLTMGRIAKAWHWFRQLKAHHDGVPPMGRLRVRLLSVTVALSARRLLKRCVRW